MITKKRILFLITKATWGGAQKYVYDLATHLPNGRFESIVAYGEKGQLAEILEQRHIATRQISSLGRDIALMSDVSSFFQILVLLWRERPDVLHLNSSKAAALGALAAHLSPVSKIVFTVHGWPFKEDRNFIARNVIYFVSWFTALLSHAVIVISRSDEARGKRMWLVGKKVRYVPIGIEPPAFLSREEAVTSLSISEDMPRIVTVAELTPNKGVRHAIEAIALLKQREIDVAYFVIGDGEERQALETLARERNVSDRVFFLGFVPDAATYLKGFDVFLLPSIKEGMPYALLEARAAGLPTVGTEAVDAECDFRVRVADPSELAEAMLKAHGARSSAGAPSSLTLMREETMGLY